MEELASSGSIHALFDQLGRHLPGKTRENFRLSHPGIQQIEDLDSMEIDWRLVERAKKHDPTAFAEIYDRNYPGVFNYIYFHVDENRDFAEDLTAEVFVRALDKIGTYRFKGSPLSAWLYRIASNLLVDNFRRTRPTISWETNIGQMTEATGESVETLIDEKIKREDLRMALKGLTGEQQQVVILRFVEGLSLLEVAEIIDLFRNKLSATL